MTTPHHRYTKPRPEYSAGRGFAMSVIRKGATCINCPFVFILFLMIIKKFIKKILYKHI